jgi:transposase
MWKRSYWRRCSPCLEKKAGGSARGRQRTASTHVLAKIRALNRVLCVWETMRAAPGSLAVGAPDWPGAHSQQEWEKPSDRLLRDLIGRDGAALLNALFDPAAPQWLRQVPAAEILASAWGCKIIPGAMESLAGVDLENIPPAARYIGSAYDEEAHYEPRRGVQQGLGIKSI